MPVPHDCPCKECKCDGFTANPVCINCEIGNHNKANQPKIVEKIEVVKEIPKETPKVEDTPKKKIVDSI